MTETELSELASKIVAGLNSHVIPASLPRMVGDWLRSALSHGSMQWSHSIPIDKAGITVRYILSPDGSITIEFQDINGARFWQGTLVSE